MQPEYSNVPEMAYDWMIVVYFFLGGLSAGCFLFSVATTYWKEQLRPMGKPMAILAPIVLSIGMFVLLLDLGQPLRAWRLMVSLNPRSALSWGVWFLNGFFVFSVLYAWRLWTSGPEKAKRFGYLGVPFALLVATYTGVLLAQAPGRPLWHTAIVPVLFLNGALMSGTALGLLISARRQEADLRAKVGGFLAILAIVELGMLTVELIVLLNGGGEGAAIVKELLAGSYALAFLGVEVILGLIIPAAILLRTKTPAAQIIASTLVLVGVVTMRYVIVVGGQGLCGQ